MRGTGMWVVVEEWLRRQTVSGTLDGFVIIIACIRVRTWIRI